MPSAAPAATPLSYLHGDGARADSIVPLTWALIVVSVVVIVVISALLVAAIWHRRAALAASSLIADERTGNRWIVWGVGLSSLVLLATIVWTMHTFAFVAAMPRDPAVTVEVVGYQWWWEVHYLDAAGAPVFSTANEIHIPVGERVRFKLVAADVIHSFWVPALTGKTDLIPGQTNQGWMEASRPGVYRGQCTEYCGLQHANMALLAIAEPRERFEAWEREQRRSAVDRPSAGQALFEKKCGECHTVRGVWAETGRGHGPDLTHLMSRTTLASGTFANTTGDLYGWVANPRTIKPGTQMPNVPLAPQELQAVVAFLTGLT